MRSYNAYINIYIYKYNHTPFPISYHTFLQLHFLIWYNKIRYLGYRNVKEGFDEVF